jgi:hypothetical protein
MLCAHDAPRPRAHRDRLDHRRRAPTLEQPGFLWRGAQREIGASVGLDDSAFPGQDDGALVARCALEANELVLTRLPAVELPDNLSGWMLACASEHDHGERSLVPLLAIAAIQPALVQLLALPHGTSVLVVFREKPAEPGALRIEPHVFRGGTEIVPKPGSYLAGLQA